MQLSQFEMQGRQVLPLRYFWVWQDAQVVLAAVQVLQLESQMAAASKPLS